LKKLTFFVIAACLAALVPASLRANEALLKAFEKGETETIIRLFKDNPQMMTADLGTGMTSLHYAVYYGNETVVDYVLKSGIDLNIKDKRNLTPVWFSVSGGRPAMLKKLIALGADLKVQNPAGDNLLFRAVNGGNLEVIGILLANGFTVEMKNSGGATPAVYAAQTGGVDVLKFLASKGVDLKAVDPNSHFTLLHQAVFSGRTEAIHYLLDQGLDIDARGLEGDTPLLVAVNIGNIEGALALVRRGADVNAADASGITPFLFAVKKGAKDLVALALANKADIAAVDVRTGKTSLHEAALRGYSAIVADLLKAGAAKDAKDKQGHTALSYALKYGNQAAADVLKKAGVAEVPWETNLEDAVYLKKPLADGEATIWYLKHSGWALKTKSAFLVFDYWDNDTAPDIKLLANGHIDPAELKDLKVYVFVTHEHADHNDKQILDWKKTIPGIQYILGFESDAEDVISMAPRTERKIGDLAITTIQANDAGVGFAVKVDGLTIFHAGDHSNNTLEMAGNNFYPEIDYLAERGIHPDIAFFLNMYGCGSTNPEAFQKGIFYAVDKLKIKAVLPMHGAYKEWVYGNLVEGVAKNKIDVQVGAAVNQGDRFSFRGGKLKN
jgi:ankyrin repeat protein/L-ascorbate metabolism protein UlaG (beta-lactamase superfamily)